MQELPRNFQYRYTSTNTQPPKKPKRGRTVLAIFAVLILGGLAAKALLPSLQAKVHSINITAAAAPLKPAAINQAVLATPINQAINDSSLETGVSIIDLTNNQHYNYGLGATDYVAASTTKLLSATLFLHDVEQGQYALTDPLADSTAQNQLRLMIVDSDNNAWQAFNDLLGHPALLQYANNAGMNSYDPDDNTITSDDLALLLAKLYDGKLLDSQHTKLLLSYMHQADYTQYIAAAVPSGVQFYHKAGYLDDRAMDAAIIDNGKHPYVLVIFTKDPSGNGYDQTAGQQVFHSITTATLAAFAR